MRAYRCISQGRVQGVWYRRHVAEMAKEAGFVGYVRNLPDNTVESVVVTDPQGLESFKKILYKGSPMSMVTQVVCEMIDTEERFETFEVRR